MHAALPRTRPRKGGLVADLFHQRPRVIQIALPEERFGKPQRDARIRWIILVGLAQISHGGIGLAHGMEEDSLEPDESFPRNSRLACLILGLVDLALLNQANDVVFHVSGLAGGHQESHGDEKLLHSAFLSQAMVL